MATAPRARAGSGGKVLRPRRVARIATPYDRPPNPIPRPENPNWISKLLLSPTRVIASGAGKLLSSVFGPESSSSSSSSSGSDSGSDDEIEEDNDGSSKSSPGQDGSNEESQQAAVTNGNKLLIEQLLMQETFSWEESEKLTRMIKSRVVETPACLDREVGRPDVEIPDICNTALMEAKKWLKEKKSISSPELDLDPTRSPHVNEGEMGSPVDVAKSFMKERTPWTSPVFNSEAQTSASPIGIRLFKDDGPFSFNGKSLSPSKVQMKRDGPIIGSWNISEEIRRVRSKATEQMLRTPSTKNDLSASKPRSSATQSWSASVLGYKYSVNSPIASMSEAVLREKNQASKSMLDASSDIPSVNTANRIPPTTENRSDNEVPSVNPPVLISEQDKDLDREMKNDDQGLEDGVGDTKTILPSDTCPVDGTTYMDTNGSSQEHVDIIPDSRADDGFCSISKEGPGTGDAPVQNGIPHSSFRLDAERDIRSYDEELNPPTPSLPTSHLEETSEPLKEAPNEALKANENDDIVTGSQNSSSMQYEEPQDVSELSTKQAATPKRGRKVARYGRKVRGRGK